RSKRDWSSDVCSSDLNSGEVKSRTLDEMGRAYAVGRRKESSARCYLVEGEGKMLVNGLELDQYFQRSVDRNEVTLPLDVTELKRSEEHTSELQSRFDL